ncbi:MAG: ABC transporter substrate-binding protein [Xanthobacteraceae bacterium]
MRQSFVIDRLAISCLLAAAIFAAAPARAADQVSVQLDWVVRGNHAMFFVARDKGYFEKNGITVTAIRKGTGSTDALRLVANGNAEFGFGDLPTLLVARSQNIPAVALVAVNQRSPLAMLSVKARNPLTKPDDLKGLNIGVHPSGSTYIFLKAFFAQNGMNLQDVKQSTVAPPYESYLVLGRVDAVPGYIDAEVPELEAKTGGPGSLSILQGADYGYHAYGSGLFTSEKMIAERPDLVQRFVTAYLQAFQDVIADPKGAVDIVVKANPEYKEKSELLGEQLKADIDHTFFNETSRERGIGVISAKQWTETVQTLQSQAVLPKEASPTGGYDSHFAEAAKPLRR